jgi:tRNA A-37 threonylcarbamoyl transferase component Bud32
MNSVSGQYSDHKHIAKQRIQKLYSHDYMAFKLHCTQSILGHSHILLRTS